MKKLLLFCILFVILSTVYAQSYKTAIGVRAGLPLGITFKQFLNEKSALEGIVGGRSGGGSLSILYEYHMPTNQYPALNWYFGFGGAAGLYDKRSPWVIEDGQKLIIGAQLIGGIEYTFEDLPLNLSFDWIPLVNLIGYSNFDFLQFGLSVRYVF